MMFVNAWNFIKERYPLQATIPVSLVLFCAPLTLNGYTIYDAVSGWTSTFAALLCLRIADDISDIEKDHIRMPERGLPSGKIDTLKLRRFLYICLIVIFTINIWPWQKGAMVVAVILFYFFFFKFKNLVHLVIQSCFINLIFGLISIYVCFLNNGTITLSYILIGLFTWLSVVAHDFAHSVHGENEEINEIPDFSKIFGPRQSAILSIILYVLATFTGFLFWPISGKPLLFIVFLSATTLQILYLGIKLIKNPVSSKAKVFYIYGFTFFLIPSIGLIIDRMLLNRLGI
jgi:4-hydroxybenzoate polyprenyltransferase